MNLLSNRFGLIQLWNYASKSNIEVISCKNIAFRTIIAAYQFDRNEIIHRDLNISFIQDEINKFTNKHVKSYPKATAKQLLDNLKDFRRFKRLKP